MKKIIGLLVVVCIVVAAIVFVPELVHKCDDCDKTFFGTGYRPAALSELVTEDMEIICEECAEKHHKLSIVLGKELDEFKRELFEKAE